MKRQLLGRCAILFVVAVAAWGAGLYLVREQGPYREEGVRAEPPAHQVGGLVVSADALRMGEVWEAKAFLWDLPIQNVTSRTVEVTAFYGSCGCLDIEPKSLIIPARENAKIRLKVDLTLRQTNEIGLPRRPVSFEIIPVVKHGSGVHGKGWRLHGEVRSKVTLGTLGLHFGESPVHGQPPVVRKVSGTIHVPCQGVQAVVDPGVATVQVRTHPEDTKRFELVVAPLPALPPGPFKTEVCVNLITQEGNSERVACLPVEGEMQPEIRLLPARLLLPGKKVGETAVGEVVLQVPPGQPAVVEQIETDSPDLIVAPLSLDGLPSGKGFRVSLRVTRPGDQSQVVRFVLRREGQGRVTIPMQVYCRGESAPGTTEKQEGSKRP